jgi:hypothetical protein
MGLAWSLPGAKRVREKLWFIRKKVEKEKHYHRC